MESLLYLDRAAVARACTEVDVLACVAEALRQHADGTAAVPDEAVLRWRPVGGGEARTLSMPGMLDGPDPVVGVKVINASTENPNRGLTRADGLTLLFDPVTARPRAILHGARISALRTAAVSTLAAQQLGAGGPATLAVVGAGAIARTHVEVMVDHLGLERVVVCDVVPERAARLVDDMRDAVDIVAVAEPEKAVMQATIVVAATTVTAPYLRYHWLAPGTVVVNVSLDDVEEEVFVRADGLYVDDWSLVMADSRRLLGRLGRAGTIAGPGEAPAGAARVVDGTLGQLLTGRCPGRQDDGEIMLVNPFGMAIEDLAVASRVYEVAVARGDGVVLER